MSGDLGKYFYVVDDEPALRQTIVAALSSINLKVESFADGIEFLDAQKKLTQGCIFLDVRMPNLDGLEVLKQLQLTWPGAPVVMISGLSDISTAVKAMRLGAVDFIEKPFQLDQLFEVVKSVQNGIEDKIVPTPVCDKTEIESQLSSRGTGSVEITV